MNIDTDRLRIYGASEKWLRDHDGLYDRIAAGEEPEFDRHGVKLRLLRLERTLKVDDDGSTVCHVVCEKLRIE